MTYVGNYMIKRQVLEKILITFKDLSCVIYARNK
jgi:hypothetical protein